MRHKSACMNTCVQRVISLNKYNQRPAVSIAADSWQPMLVISYRERTCYKQEFSSKHVCTLSLICEHVSCNLNVFCLLGSGCFSAKWLIDVVCHSKWAVYCRRATALVWTPQTSGPVNSESLTENCSSFSDVLLSGGVIGSMWGVFGNIKQLRPKMILIRAESLKFMKMHLLEMQIEDKSCRTSLFAV